MSVVSTRKLLLLCPATVVHVWVSSGGGGGSDAAAGTAAVLSCSC